MASDPGSEWAPGDWAHIEQAWRDWQSANQRTRDEPTNTLLERAWAAGLFDTEAASAAGIVGGFESGTFAMVLQIQQPYRDQGLTNLERFQRAVGGAGVISGPHARLASSPCYIWMASRQEDVDKVWIAIGPFLGLSRFAEFRRALVVPALREFEPAPVLARRRKRRVSVDRKATQAVAPLNGARQGRRQRSEPGT